MVRAFVALEEDLGSVSNTYMVVHNSNPKGPITSMGTRLMSGSIYTCGQSTHTHTLEIKLEKEITRVHSSLTFERFIKN